MLCHRLLLAEWLLGLSLLLMGTGDAGRRPSIHLRLRDGAPSRRPDRGSPRLRVVGGPGGARHCGSVLPLRLSRAGGKEGTLRSGALQSRQQQMLGGSWPSTWGHPATTGLVACPPWQRGPGASVEARACGAHTHVTGPLSAPKVSSFLFFWAFPALLFSLPFAFFSLMILGVHTLFDFFGNITLGINFLLCLELPL